MVEYIIARHIEYLQRDIARLQTTVVIAALNVASQRLRPLIAGIDAETTAVVVEVELIVLVDATPFFGVDGYSNAYSPVDAYNCEGSLMAGLQVGTGIDAVHSSFRMEVVA